MTSSTFFQYISGPFFKHLQHTNAKFPVILFVDGHTSHLSLQTTEFCLKNKIILMALFPNSTRILQPMDVGLFHTIKDDWKSLAQEWKFENRKATMGKQDFCKILRDCLLKVEGKPHLFESAFRASGIYPFNPDAVDYSRIIEDRSKAKLKREEEATKYAEEAKKEQDEYAIAFKRIGELLGKEKENLFFKMMMKSKTAKWSGSVEDETAYHLWKEAFERSQDDFQVDDDDGCEENDIDYSAEIRNFVPEWNEYALLDDTNEIMISEPTSPPSQNIHNSVSPEKPVETVVQSIPPESTRDSNSIQEYGGVYNEIDLIQSQTEIQCSEPHMASSPQYGNKTISVLSDVPVTNLLNLSSILNTSNQIILEDRSDILLSKYGLDHSYATTNQKELLIVQKIIASPTAANPENIPFCDPQSGLSFEVTEEHPTELVEYEIEAETTSPVPEDSNKTDVEDVFMKCLQLQTQSSEPKRRKRRFPKIEGKQILTLPTKLILTMHYFIFYFRPVRNYICRTL